MKRILIKNHCKLDVGILIGVKMIAGIGHRAKVEIYCKVKLYESTDLFLGQRMLGNNLKELWKQK